uniref:U6 snRNA phosphodiesterase 1 n=1 Tax=Calcidiscus leptoporus TaxID=127549 RepID=A0A7S0J8T9_9EUKA|mmetsp:Transcript_45136/g.105425  ORF Transcript_45136/g.105425 Transcript_45136/m.105425 type:complete len:306 (+) Transcript_45136:158-1075(+)
MDCIAALYGSDGSDGSDDAETEDAAPRPHMHATPLSPSQRIIACGGAAPPAAHEQTTTSECAAPMALPSPPLSEDDEEEAGLAPADAERMCPVRQFGHVDGQFAAHVFAHVHLPGQAQGALTGLLSQVAANASAVGSRVQAIDAMLHHMSLSRTLTLTLTQIDPFVEALLRATRSCRALALRTGSVAHLANDTSTRFFAAVELVPDEPERLEQLIDAIDQVVVRYGAQPFYAERRAHFSIAWSLQPMGTLDARTASALHGHVLQCSSVVCRVGERETQLQLMPCGSPLSSTAVSSNRKRARDQRL